MGFVHVCMCVCVHAWHMSVHTHVSSWLFATAGDLSVSADDEEKSDTFLSLNLHTAHLTYTCIAWRTRTKHKPECHFCIELCIWSFTSVFKAAVTLTVIFVGFRMGIILKQSLKKSKIQMFIFVRRITLPHKCCVYTTNDSPALSWWWC